MRLGIVGLDSSHAVQFAKLINQDTYPDVSVTCAYPWGSSTIPSSARRIPQYRDEIQRMDVRIAESIAELVAHVDGVLLVTNDGNLRLTQARQIFQAGKPLFVDKPFAASLSQVLAIMAEAERHGVRIFSSSALRYADGVAESRGRHPIGCDTFGPCYLEPSHSDLYWYGVHGIEMLIAVMGHGCQSVARHAGDRSDIVVCRWEDGRLGTYRAFMSGPAIHGGRAHFPDGHVELGDFSGFGPLVREIVEFFCIGSQPVDVGETEEIYTVMAAAELSSQRGGAPVLLDEARQVAMSDVTTRGKPLGPGASQRGTVVEREEVKS